MSDNLIEITPSAYVYPLLLKQLLHTSLARSPDQVIVYRERRHTYRQFRDRVGRLASGLTELGLKPGEVVAVMDWDSHRYHECYFTVPMMGAVLQTVNLALPPDQLQYILADTGATTLLVNVDFLPLIEPSSPFFVFPDFDENTRATTFHTTGTTGRPKGVYFSHRQMVLHVLSTLVELNLSPSQGRLHRDDVYMPMTPMFHVHAWGVPYS